MLEEGRNCGKAAPLQVRLKTVVQGVAEVNHIMSPQKKSGAANAAPLQNQKQGARSANLHRDFTRAGTVSAPRRAQNNIFRAGCRIEVYSWPSFLRMEEASSPCLRRDLPMTRSRIFVFSVVATLLFLMAASSFPAQAQAPAHKLVKFNAPGAGTSAGQGTVGAGILADGSILGSYIDSSFVSHGYLRSPAGAFTNVDPPGSQGTFVTGINSALAIVGYSVDTSGVYHGFLRAPGGTFTTLDDPGAGTGSGQGTLAGNINTTGEITGAYIDSNGTYHGFLRSPGGNFVTFDAPGAGAGSGQGTFPAFLCGVTDGGALAGSYLDSSSVYHGFLRSPSGAYTEFDPSGSIETLVAGISANDAVAGYYYDSTGVSHGFLRTLDGTITSYEAPNATATTMNNIDSGGAISGLYYDTNGVTHGYVRAANGTFKEFSVPGAGTGSGQGTSANESNATGQITGNFLDSNSVNHGFVFE